MSTRALRRVAVALVVAPLAVVALLGTAARSATAHPLHTTLTELRDGGGRGVEAVVRVFVDDFATAVARTGRGRARSPGTLAATDAFAYAAAHFTLADRHGRPLPLRWCGWRRQGDLLWLCLRAVDGAPSRAGLAGLRVSNRLLFDRFDDQVNVVQAAYAGRRASLLFTPGDGAKPLPE